MHCNINEKYEPCNIKNICKKLYDIKIRTIFYTIDELLDHNSKVLDISDIHQVCSIKLIRTDYVYPNSINTKLTFDVKNDDLYQIILYEFKRLLQKKKDIDKNRKHNITRTTHNEYRNLLDHIDYIRKIGFTLNKIRNKK